MADTHNGKIEIVDKRVHEDQKIYKAYINYVAKMLFDLALENTDANLMYETTIDNYHHYTLDMSWESSKMLDQSALDNFNKLFVCSKNVGINNKVSCKEILRYKKVKYAFFPKPEIRNTYEMLKKLNPDMTIKSLVVDPHSAKFIEAYLDKVEIGEGEEAKDAVNIYTTEVKDDNMPKKYIITFEMLECDLQHNIFHIEKFLNVVSKLMNNKHIEDREINIQQRRIMTVPNIPGISSVRNDLNSWKEYHQDLTIQIYHAECIEKVRELFEGYVGDSSKIFKSKIVSSTPFSLCNHKTSYKNDDVCIEFVAKCDNGKLSDIHNFVSVNDKVFRYWS